MQLAIGLRLRNTEALTNVLREIYDRSSPNYHHYLTPQEFTDRFGPTEKDYQELTRFAAANNLKVTATHPNRVLLDVSGSVADVEQAFHVTLHSYQHPTEPREFYAPDAEPSLDITVPVLKIIGLDNYSLPRPRLKQSSLAKSSNASPKFGSGPSGTYMGYDFRSAYVPGSTVTGSNQVVGLLEFDGYTTADITYYEVQAGLPSMTLTNVLIDGFSGAPSGSGGEVEVSLDIEVAISMAPGLSEVILYEAPNPSPFDDILNRMVTDNAANQLSCSWGLRNGGIDPVADEIFEEMAAQGQSFFCASGDSDAYTGPIDFPSEDPYITQVGGTTLTTSGPGGFWESEKVWNWGSGTGSGGGISTRYSIPTWQSGVNMSANQGSSTMRNIPDVAMTADNVYVRADGADQNVGGTSCAAPLWAGFAALANQQAAASGSPNIGFINPAIYLLGEGANYPNGFHDITTGDNTSPYSPNQFFAVPGYDLCTGWGTPAGQGLIDALALPPESTPPSILAQPQSQTVPTAGQAIFNVTATGSPQLNYAWSFNGTNIDGATNSSLVLPYVLPGDAGDYSVQVTNAFGFVTSSNALLTVLPPVAPVIVTQPQDQTAVLGGLAIFSVVVTGTPPIYQWTFDDNAIPGATNSSFVLINAQTSNEGEYAVQVTNLAGYVSSSNATLTVLAPGTNCDTAPTNLVGWWPANNDAVNVVDGTTATLDGPVGFVSGEDGDAFSFNGSNTDVHVASGYDLGASDGLTIEMWISPSGVAQFQPLLEWGDLLDPWNGLSLWLSIPTFEGGTGPGSIALDFIDDNLGDHFISTPAGLIIPNSWRHVAATYDKTSGIVTLYLDGSPVVQTNFGTVRPETVQDLWFGTDPVSPNWVGIFGAGTHYSGLMDEVSIYNRALSTTEIQNIYIAGSFGKCPFSPTSVTIDPVRQIVIEGNTASFSALANGTTPLSYQWSFDGTNISNATNSSLSLSDVQLSQSGNYTVAVSNSVGSLTASPASLSVAPPSGVNWVKTSAPTNTWQAISCSADGTRIVAAAYHGLVYTSTNSGLTWNPANVPTDYWNSASCSADGTKFFAGGSKIYRSTNSGATWSFGTAGTWYSLASSADGTRVAAVYSPYIYISTDSGDSWNGTAAPSGNWYNVASSSDGSELIAVGLPGNYTSKDFGTSWTANNTPSGFWSTVAVSADGSKAMSALYNGGIYISTNSSATWNITPAPATSWAGLTCSADGTKLVAVANSSVIYSSWDSGHTWQQDNVPLVEWRCVASSADGTRLFAGAADGIYTWQIPSLNICVSNGCVVLSWPTNAPGLVLQLNSTLNGAGWQTVTNDPFLNLSNQQYQVTLLLTDTNAFFRLKSPE